MKFKKYLSPNRNITLFLLLIMFFVVVKNVSANSFPGAEGFGAETRGAYALYEQTHNPNDLPEIIHVTNLNNSGEGSLRVALESSGPRIVVFDVGGVVQLGSNNIEIKSSYLTLAGQTAPGNGIVVKGSGIRVMADDIIIRGMRLRPGPDHAGNGETNGLVIQDNDPHNVIWDHCSVSWSTDENVSFWRAMHNVTIQNSIIAKPLNDSTHPKGKHGYNLIVGPEAVNVSIHHNLIAHAQDRNPLLSARMHGVEFINNIVYGSRQSALRLVNEGGGGSTVNAINNIYQRGPDDWDDYPVVEIGIPGSKVYLKGNIGKGRLTDDISDEWALASASSDVRSDSPVFDPSGITITPLNEMERMFDDIGARQPTLDNVDRDIIQELKSCSGNLIDNLDSIEGCAGGIIDSVPEGGYSYYTESHRSSNFDTDQDGIPDSWEQSHSSSTTALNPHNMRDGYSELEHYINHFFETNEAQSAPAQTHQPTPTPQPTVTPGRKYNINNFIQLIQNWLQTGNEQSDVNNDNIVNTRDLGIMMSNWTGGTVSSCAKEGENYSEVHEEYPNECCVGLTKWESGMDTRKVENGVCVETDSVSGNPIGACINCGNNICEEIENVCNCPQDCGNSSTPTPTSTPQPTTNPNPSGNTIADHTVAKESVLRSIPKEFIDKARNNSIVAYPHTSHGTHVSFGLWGLPYYKSGDSSLFKIGGSDGLDFRDMRNTGMDGCRDLSAGENCWHTATRSYLSSHPEVNVIMWSWCQIEGHSVSNYLSRMEDLINDYPNVTFILMTGHDNSWGDGAKDQANLILNKARQEKWYVLDYYNIDTHDMEDNYHERAGDDADFYSSWQDSHTKGEDWYECRNELDGSVETGAHNSQHITCNRKAYAMWWILARIAGWGG